VREELKAEEFIVFVNSSIDPDSGLRHINREDLLGWAEMGFFKHTPEYYLEDRLTAIQLLRYERDLLSRPRDVPVRGGRHRLPAGISQRGCVQVVSCVGAYPESEMIMSGLKETNLISSVGIISVNCGFVSKRTVKPPDEGPRAASTGGELFVLQVEVGSPDTTVESAVTPLGVKQFSEDDTLFRSLSNLNPDSKPVCIFEKEGEIQPGEAIRINVPFPPEPSGTQTEAMKPDGRFSKSYFSVPFLIPVVTIRGAHAAMVELTYVTHDRQRVPRITSGETFPSRLYPLFLGVDADSMQSIVNFIATYCVHLQFKSSSGNPQEDFRDEQRRMREILEKAREGRLSEEDIGSASTPHEDIMVEQSFVTSLVNDPHNADILSVMRKTGHYQEHFVPVRRFYGWLDYMWGELLVDVAENLAPRICRGCGAVIRAVKKGRGRPKEYCPQCDESRARAKERWRRRKGKAE
jgi:hypothetical protein